MTIQEISVHLAITLMRYSSIMVKLINANKVVRLLLLIVVWTILFGSIESKSAETEPPRVTKSFPSYGITTVVLRAYGAEEAKTTTRKARSAISVSGVPKGGASGYHSPDPDWEETRPEEWGLSFKSKKFGSPLVISTFNEMAYIHHHYYLHKIVLSTPPGVKVIKQNRSPSGEGAPDLTKPVFK